MATSMVVSGIEDLAGRTGERAGPTAWRSISQGQIDQFAELTNDHQWIHVDVERASRESPFGGTVAHGDLTLSLLDGFSQELLRLDESGFLAGVNYGWNRVRFPAPVRSGSRVRASGELIEVREVGGGWWQVVTRYTVEVEGSEKPAVVADAVSRLLTSGAS
jgi:acyl dehydratase